jgi:hypothetical protein
MIAPAQPFDALIATIINGIVMSCFVIRFGTSQPLASKMFARRTMFAILGA